MLSASQQAVSMRNASTVFVRLKRTNCSERLLFLGLKAEGSFGQGSVRHRVLLCFFTERKLKLSGKMSCPAMQLQRDGPGFKPTE